MKIMISGICGRMGRTTAALAMAGAHGAELVCGVDKSGSFDGVPCRRTFSDSNADVDCVIDFSHHSATNDLLSFCISHGIPLVIATTGQTENEIAEIKAASEHIPIFMSPNFSLGVAAVIGFVKELTAMMRYAEIEIIETHHGGKSDAPSGTALALADAVRKIRPEMKIMHGRTSGKRSENEIGIHSVRIANAASKHEIIFASEYEAITLTHEAHDIRLYADGALAAAKFLYSLPHGTHGLYGIESIIREDI